MPATKCLLAATDFSVTSREALIVVRGLAAALAARVHLLHVIPDPARLPWVLESGLALDELAREWRLQAERSLERARDEAGLDLSTTGMRVAMGDPAHEIVSAAHDLHAAIIVMGSHGLGFVARVIMGSVADKVLRRADRPVLIVPHPDRHRRNGTTTEPDAQEVPA